MRQAVVVVWVVLLFAAPVQADYLESGGDAARSGMVGAGPEHFLMALDIELDGARAPNAPPLILDGDAYVLTEMPSLNSEDEPSFPVPDEVGIWRIDVDTGAHELIVDLGASERVETWASDGMHLFVVDGGHVTAYSLDGDPVWEERLVLSNGDAGVAILCPPAALHEGELLLVCKLSIADVEEGVMTGRFRFDTRNGDLLGAWYIEESPATLRPSAITSSPVALAVGADAAYLMSVLVSPAPVVNTCAPAGVPGSGVFVVVDAIGHDDQLQWTWSAPLPVEQLQGQGTGDPARLAGQVLRTGSIVLANDLLFVVTNAVQAIDVEDGCLAWEEPLIFPEAGRPGFGTAAAVGGELVVGAQSAFWAVDQQGDGIRLGPIGVVPFENRAPMLVWEEFAATGSTTGLLRVFDIRDGSLLFSDPLGDFERGMSLAVASGLLVGVSGNARVAVIGTTGASPQPDVRLPDAYPAFGEALSIDLSASSPGALAEGLQFRVDWGDGSAEPWSNSTRYEHAYDAPPGYDPDDPVAVASLDPIVGAVHVRNSAGQEALQTFTVYPGMPAPRLSEDEPLLSRAFAQENQEATFFLLGVLLTMLTASFGAWRLSSKRRRLRAELAHVEEQEKIGRRDAGEAEKGLRLLEGRATDLLAMRKLEEAQYAVLSDRIQTARRRIRVGIIEDDFGFLPLKVARRLQAMLTDGTLEAWEHEAIAEAVESESGLSAAHRKATLQQVDAWFKADRA